MASLSELERPGWPREGDERHVISTFLEFYRVTLAIKCRDLSDEQLRSRSISSSNLSLLGILRHMRETERYWFEEIFLAREPIQLFDNSVDPDADFNDLDSHPVEVVIDSWIHQGVLSRQIVLEHSLDELSAGDVKWIGGSMNLRSIVVHLIEEYARHCGHADLLREAIDGVSGH